MSIREITQRIRLIGLILRHESMSAFTTMELNSSRLRGGGEIVHSQWVVPFTTEKTQRKENHCLSVNK